MIKITARLKLNHVRKTGITTGYRPLFSFIIESMTSGHIQLLDRDELFPGEEAIVEILFLNEDLLGNFSKGQVVKLGESPRTIVGEIEIINSSSC